MRVKVNNCYSAAVLQTSGIAQGTCMGPLCFSMYINDLPNHVTNCKCELFADDAKVFDEFNENCTTFKLQVDLDEIVKWADTWQLNILVPKSYIVHLGHNNPKHTYMLNGNIIPVRDEVADLGVTCAINYVGIHSALTVQKKQLCCQCHLALL